MRRVNAEGMALLKQWEGLKLEAYQDTGGVWTIGYGHTGSQAVKGATITQATAEGLFRADLSRFEDCVDRLVTVDLTDNQFTALVSLAYNIGEGAFSGSTLLRLLNGGDCAAVPAQLMRWVKDNGKDVPGLVNRRAAEAGLWARGSFVVSAGPTSAQPARPSLVTPENVAIGASAVGAAGSVASGEGPVQWAFAGVILVAVVVAAVVFLKRLLRPS